MMTKRAILVWLMDRLIIFVFYVAFVVAVVVQDDSDRFDQQVQRIG